MKTLIPLLALILAFLPFASRADENQDKLNQYLTGAFPEGETLKIDWTKIQKEDWPRVIDHVAAKPVLTGNDARIVYALTTSGEQWPQLKPRHADILAFYPANTMKHYFVKYKKLAGARPNTIHLKRMTLSELMLVTTGEMTMLEEEQIRGELLARCVKAAKAQTQDPAVLTQKIQPVIEALNAPKWQGLQAAATPLGLTIPAPDYKKLEADLRPKENAVKQGSVSYGKRFSGSVLFIKGMSDYLKWEGELPATAAVRDTPAAGVVPGVTAGRQLPDVRPGKPVDRAAAVAALVADEIEGVQAGIVREKALAAAKEAEENPDEFTLALNAMGDPKGGFLTRLRQQVLDAHLSGDTASRDVLLEKYREQLAKFTTPEE